MLLVHKIDLCNDLTTSASCSSSRSYESKRTFSLHISSVWGNAIPPRNKMGSLQIQGSLKPIAIQSCSLSLNLFFSGQIPMEKNLDSIT